MRIKTMLSIAIPYGIITVICLGFSVIDCIASEGQEEFHPVDLNRIPEVLNLISIKILDNYGQIKTWHGIAEGILTYGRYRTVQFDLNVEKELLYVDDYPAELIEDTNGRYIRPKKEDDNQIAILSPDYYIGSKTIINGIEKNRIGFRELRKKDCPTCRSSLPFVFDPRSQLKQPFAIIQKSFPVINKKCQQIDQNKQNILFPKVEEMIKNGIIKYRIIESFKISFESNDPNYLIMSSIFSSDKGYNIISQETTLHTLSENRITQERVWDYDLVDGIYVLSKTMTQSYSLDKGKSVFYEDITFKDVKINKPIPNELFSHNNLGLKNGDKFIDKVEGKEYKYEDFNLVFVKDLPASANGNQGIAPNQKVNDSNNQPK